MESNKEKSKIVLHVCCAVCGAYLSEVLKDKFETILFFYNPNIHPEQEYEKRKQSVVRLSEIYNLEFYEGEYDVKHWLQAISGFENEPEGGKRCPICFRERLIKTAELAKKIGADHFITTLAMSPYKDEKQINEIGENIAQQFNLKFVKTTDLDLTKQEAWQKTRQLAKKYEFYHQKYCGCRFSITS